MVYTIFLWNPSSRIQMTFWGCFYSTVVFLYVAYWPYLSHAFPSPAPSCRDSWHWSLVPSWSNGSCLCFYRSHARTVQALFAAVWSSAHLSRSCQQQCCCPSKTSHYLGHQHLGVSLRVCCTSHEACRVHSWWLALIWRQTCLNKTHHCFLQSLCCAFG